MKKSPFAILKEKNIRQEIYMLLPACILLIVFMVAPFVSAFGLSLTNQKLIPNPMVPAKFVGFRNYIQIFKDTSFWQAFKNVILFTIMVIPLQCGFALLMANALNKVKPLLENGKAARLADLTDEEKAALYDSHLITMKPMMYVCNVDEDGIQNGSPYIDTVKKIAGEEGSDVVVICGKFEADLAEMESEEERMEFLAEIGLKESGLAVLARAAYHLMGLRTFFTAGADECRAWTIHAGDTAPKAAGVIHTDFEKGFIKAEVYRFEDLVEYGTEAKIREAGKYRQEGKEYIVQDGDVIFFKFNV